MREKRTRLRLSDVDIHLLQGDWFRIAPAMLCSLRRFLQKLWLLVFPWIRTISRADRADLTRISSVFSSVFLASHDCSRCFDLPASSMCVFGEQYVSSSRCPIRFSFFCLLVSFFGQLRAFCSSYIATPFSLGIATPFSLGI